MTQKKEGGEAEGGGIQYVLRERECDGYGLFPLEADGFLSQKSLE